MRPHLKLAILLAPCVLASSLSAATPRVLKTRFTTTATVAAAPPASKTLHLWVPVPSDNPLQTIGELTVSAPGPWELTTETENGNRMVHVQADPAKLPAVVTVSFDVARQAGGESGPLKQDVDPVTYLDAERLVPISGRSAELGREVAGSKTGAVEKMRAIYDHVVATMEYDYKKESPHLGEGNVPFVCDYKKGNCSDLHSYVIALARSQGIPAYLEYGFPITGIPLADPIPITGKVGGYHCWTWFFVEGRGWLPVDASDGRRWLDSKRPDMTEKLATSLVLERSAVAFSKGRDITLVPAQAAPPLNYFVYPYAEADGKPVEAAWTVAYELAPPDGLEAQVAELRKLVMAQAAEIERMKAERDVAKAAAPKAPAGTASGEAISFYGQVRLDAIRDSAQMSPNAASPSFVKSPDDTSVDGDKSNDQYTIHPRLTRLGLNLKAPADAVPGWAISGKIEMDFQGGGSESRPNPRARLLFADFKKGPHAWRVGQDWDTIAPLIPSPNDDTVMWNVGNTGDRRAQVRYTFDKGTGFNLAAAMGLTGAIDAKDLDANGTRDGEDSGVPGLQARFGWKGKKAAFGLWGYKAWEETTLPVAGETDFGSDIVGIDWSAPLGKRADLRGEAWTGSNLSDIRGGVGQGVNTTTGRTVSSRGGWIELGFNTTPKHRLAVGYTVDDPDGDDLGGNGRTKNFAEYIHNKWQLGANFELGANVLFWETEYKSLATGKNRRLDLYLSRKF
jgi:transglutaminase-like putative cysteine protease